LPGDAKIKRGVGGRTVCDGTLVADSTRIVGTGVAVKSDLGRVDTTFGVAPIEPTELATVFEADVVGAPWFTLDRLPHPTTANTSANKTRIFDGI